MQKPSALYNVVFQHKVSEDSPRTNINTQ